MCAVWNLKWRAIEPGLGLKVYLNYKARRSDTFNKTHVCTYVQVHRIRLYIHILLLNLKGGYVIYIDNNIHIDIGYRMQ